MINHKKYLEFRLQLAHFADRVANAELLSLGRPAEHSSCSAKSLLSDHRNLRTRLKRFSWYTPFISFVFNSIPVYRLWQRWQCDLWPRQPAHLPGQDSTAEPDLVPWILIRFGKSPISPAENIELCWRRKYLEFYDFRKLKEICEQSH